MFYVVIYKLYVVGNLASNTCIYWQKINKVYNNYLEWKKNLDMSQKYIWGKYICSSARKCLLLTIFRPHCENETWTNDRNYYCFKHLKVLCNSCFASLHSNCKHEEITHKKDVEEIMNSVRDLLSFTKRNSIEFNAHDYIPEATQEIKDHINSFLEIERRVSNSLLHTYSF